MARQPKRYRRKNAAAVELQSQTRRAAAIKLQCQTRRFISRRELQRRRLHASQRERATWRMKRGRRTAARRRCAVLDIQRSYRSFLGRKRAKARKHELVKRVQRQYRRHRERLAILKALSAIRDFWEKNEARAKEVESRFRGFEKERLLNGTGGSDAVVTPLEERRTARAYKRLLSRMKAETSRTNRHGRQMWPPPSSPALTAALARTRGIVGRLGTPLGSPYPAKRELWETDWSEPAAAYAAVRRKAELAGGGFKPFALGSRFFPAFVFAGAVARTVARGALCPVVFEMVQDAADDETDTEGVYDNVEGNVMGWHGLKLYRPPGISQGSPVFQAALQVETIAFSPDLQRPRHSATRSPCPGAPENRVTYERSSQPAQATKVCDGQPANTRVPTCCDQAYEAQGRSGWPGRKVGPKMKGSMFVAKPRPYLYDDFTFGLSEHMPRRKRAEERQIGGNNGRWEIPGPRAGRSVLVPPTPSHVAMECPTLFDSGDMIMTARLLAHPGSSLKRLLLHRAKLSTPQGREALLKCLEINKLHLLALGGCTWFDDAIRNKNPRKHIWQVDRWWEKVCDTIRTSGFRLQELVVEGLDGGGDALGVALGKMLDDYFAKRFGSLAAISLVRCGLSDEGAAAVARGIWASPALTHVDLSANVISDSGAEALAKALVGDCPVEPDEMEEGIVGGGDYSVPCHRHRPTVLKTLDLGQNRVMDPGGIVLAMGLGRSASLESITLSHNFMMKEAAEALLRAAASSRVTLREIHCEGNLFDEGMCRRITQALEQRGESRSPLPPPAKQSSEAHPTKSESQKKNGEATPSMSVRLPIPG